MSGPLLWSWNTRSPQIHRTAQTRSELFCFLKPNWIHFLNVGTHSPQRRRKVRRIWDRPVPSAQRRATPGRSDTFPDWFPEVLNPQPANRPYRGANPDGPSSSHSKHGNSYKMTRSHEEGRVKAATFGKVVRIIQVIFSVFRNNDPNAKAIAADYWSHCWSILFADVSLMINLFCIKVSDKKGRGYWLYEP